MSQLATETLSVAIGGGCLVAILCERFRIQPALPLIALGSALGHNGLGVIDARSLGDALPSITSVVVGLLVFEGGLHLNRETLAKAPRALLGLLTIGVLISCAATAVAGQYLVGLSWPAAFLLGSALVVTGPTVIQPMLRRLPVTPSLHAALAGEAILVDPIGVVFAASTGGVAAAWMLSGVEAPSASVLLQLAEPFGTGIAVGLGLGVAASLVFRMLSARRRAPVETMSLLALATCMLAVGAGESFAPEAGLVAAALCSVILANVHFLGISELREFKQRLATIFVSMLFMVLASRIDLIALAKSPPSHWWFLAALVLLVRPASVIASTIGSRLHYRERAFAALVAPRGIVAASLGSLLAVQVGQILAERVADESRLRPLLAELEQFESLVFIAVIGTIAWSSLTAPLLARVLGVRAPARSGVIIVGAHPLARSIGQLLRARDIPVHLVDTSVAKVLAAQAQGLDASVADATDARWMDDHLDRPELGWLLPLTGNRDVDSVTARWAEERFGAAHVLQPRAWRDGHAGGEVGADLMRDAEAGTLEVAVAPAGEVAEAALGSIADGRVGTLERSTGRKETMLLVVRRKPSIT